MSSFLNSHAATTSLATVNHLRPSKTQLFSWRRSGTFRLSPLRASGTSQYYSDINLYDLLGVDSSSGKAKIKEAYRALQKRCHPDIAGPAGHDMAIVLNEVYALLSDENTRLAYDKELAKFSDYQGYTGRPVYSVWNGSDTEARAVFVDETKCVGCLKCALFADKTFAIESVYGRARVVAQWADPENKIQEAIGSCPVDCISVVERSNLAALEFIMSKQPRGRVRIGTGNTVGTRTADVFDELDKFQAKYAAHNKASPHFSKESEAWGESRASGIHAIRSISNWLYWQYPSTGFAVQNSQQDKWQHNGPSIKKLRAAAEARKLQSFAPQHEFVQETSEYWLPPTPQKNPSKQTHDSSAASPTDPHTIRKTEFLNKKADSRNPIRWSVPLASAFVAAIVVWLQPGEPVGHVKEHIGGPLALDIVNSSWSQLVLASVTWFLVALYFVELVEAVRRRR